MVETEQQAAPPQKRGEQLGLAAMEFLVLCFHPLVFNFSIFPTNVRHRTLHSTLAFHGLGREDLLGRATSMEFNGMDGWVLGGW